MNPKKTETLILIFYNDSYIFYFFFDDTFTVLKVFSKQNEPEQKSLQTAVFFY